MSSLKFGELEPDGANGEYILRPQFPAITQHVQSVTSSSLHTKRLHGRGGNTDYRYSMCMFRRWCLKKPAKATPNQRVGDWKFLPAFLSWKQRPPLKVSPQRT